MGDSTKVKNGGMFVEMSYKRGRNRDGNRGAADYQDEPGEKSQKKRLIFKGLDWE